MSAETVSVHVSVHPSHPIELVEDFKGVHESLFKTPKILMRWLPIHKAASKSHRLKVDLAELVSSFFLSLLNSIWSKLNRLGFMAAFVSLVEIKEVEHSVEESTYFARTSWVPLINIGFIVASSRLRSSTREEFSHIWDRSVHSTRSVLLLFTPAGAVAVEWIKRVSALYPLADLLAWIIRVWPTHH